MNRRQDIHLSDADLRSQFVSLFSAGSYTDAFNILNTNPQLDSKKFVAEIFNTLSSEVLALENLYYTNVDEVLASELVRFQTALDNYKKIGTYSGATQYKVNNFVMYNNLAYLCILQPPIGTLPTNTTYWALIGLRGETGANSINTTLRYAWNSATAYVTRDVVVYNDILYVAKVNNTNKVPSTSVEWEIFLEVNRRYIHTETTEDILIDDDVWYKPLAREWDYLDSSNKSWDDIDGLSLTWDEFERGAYNG